MTSDKSYSASLESAQGNQTQGDPDAHLSDEERVEIVCTT